MTVLVYDEFFSQFHFYFLFSFQCYFYFLIFIFIYSVFCFLLFNFSRWWSKSSCYIAKGAFNPFQTNDPFLCSIKKGRNLSFFDVLKKYRSGTCAWNCLIYFCVIFLVLIWNFSNASEKLSFWACCTFVLEEIKKLTSQNLDNICFF